MLIMTQDGSLVNIDHVVEIDAEANGEKWEVVAFTTIDRRQHFRTIRLATCDTEDTARRIISEIFSTYSQKIAVVDICEMVDKD